MLHEHFNGDDVRLTEVVDEPTNVAIFPGIDAVGLALLKDQMYLSLL